MTNSTKTPHPADRFITSRPVFHSAVEKGYRLDAPGLASGSFASRGAARAAYTKAAKLAAAAALRAGCAHEREIELSDGVRVCISCEAVRS